MPETLIERLARERDEARAEVASLENQILNMADRAQETRAEVERLRMALTNVADADLVNFPEDGWRVTAAARDALTRSPASTAPGGDDGR